ncbi:hypothetical protein HBH47_220610 [Parastagonospora nodorum]|nr:hypothetical protein HBH51_218290 [Parastagonospora nodorum]KAH4112773.1 hypothetical protein HBH47_220610 [Parastagonospora nodorum]KAH4596353.1 hypothetical protein HBH82_227870 [Parastagonospora nodorum]KAH4662128.1 hypothetical protein HBH78_218420 [Parastagonospora nodorum]KAH4693071.1 hypothetical protein HBH67_227730 [Parastagonospora nodorum]
MLLQRRRHRNMSKPANRNGRSCDVQKALHARPRTLVARDQRLQQHLSNSLIELRTQ